MPNILIIGVSGFLGLPIARCLLRSGNHTVYGLVRSQEKQPFLQQEEILPIIGDANDPSTYNPLLGSIPIDIVIDTSSAYESASTILHAVKAVARARQLASPQQFSYRPKLGFIYVSGSWVHGSPSRPVSDLDVIGVQSDAGPSAKAVAWRPEHENAILDSREYLDVAILRPAQLFGYGGSMWAAYWAIIEQAAVNGGMNAIRLPLDQNAKLAVLHVEDAATAVQAAVERISGLLGSWPVFDLVGETVSLDEVMEEVKRHLKSTSPIRWIGDQGDPVHQAMSLKTNNMCERARYTLDWTAKRSMMKSLPVLVKAWQGTRQR